MVTFQHIGSVFKVKVKNSGSTELANIGGGSLISGTGGWAYNNQGGGSFNLATKEFSAIPPAGNYISFKAAKETIAPEGSIIFWGWLPVLSDVKWPEIRLQLKNPLFES